MANKIVTKQKDSLLIIEDDPGLQKQLKWGLKNQYEISFAANANQAIAALRKHQPKVITLDLGLPPDPTNASEGLKLLEQILALQASTKVIVITGNDDRNNAIKAIQLGAYDFYQKPLELETLSFILSRAFQLTQLEEDVKTLSRKKYNEPLDGLISVSSSMLDIIQTVEKIAPVDITTLIQGESGTGKEVIARALHNLSPRKKQRFVAVNAAAIPDNLLESELFGYEKGAFTGAVKQTLGKIEYANKGTLFLDEIGDLPMPLQAKLLRFLQERKIERLGGRSEIEVDIRIVCASHKNIKDLIKEGLFREDLYFRLSEIAILLPPLRDRADDALILATEFVNKFSQQYNKKIKPLSDDAIQAIENNPWSGNVRELENKIKRAVIMSEGAFINSEDLDILDDKNTQEEIKNELPINLKAVREMADTQAIHRALTHTNNNISKAAELLGVTRPTLYTLFEKYHINP